MPQSMDCPRNPIRFGYYKQALPLLKAEKAAGQKLEQGPSSRISRIHLQGILQERKRVQDGQRRGVVAICLNPKRGIYKGSGFACSQILRETCEQVGEEVSGALRGWIASSSYAPD